MSKNGQDLYEEGKHHLTKALENAQFTHIHSDDIRLSVLNQYFIPAAKLGCVPAIIEVYNYYASRKKHNECIHWIKQYKEVTQCGYKELAKVFGMKMIIHLMF